MCGITGLWRFKSDVDDLTATVTAMTQSLVHRGPDDQGVWLKESIGLGQRRLAIVDLSARGHQPMCSEDGRYVLVFNGEIYNYKALAQYLKNQGVACEAHNDTEVLLQLCIQLGVSKVLPMLNGMFAFAFYDAQEKILHIARDRFGEKPLYYSFVDGQYLAFGSELKALLQMPDFDRTVDETALDLYLRLNYVPCPYSIYKRARKLFPGHYLTITLTGIKESAYFDLSHALENRQRVDLPENECVDALERLLGQSVYDRILADVPVGAFLSGGIDSSLMVALMQVRSTQPIKTFTVGFKNSPWDESKYAEAIAQHLKTDHITLFVDPDAVLENANDITQIYDEPFGDASALSTYLISKLFKKYVTVAIGGDGGDELFVGYHRHKWAPRLYTLHKWLPRPVLSLFEMINSRLLSERCPMLHLKLHKAVKGLRGKDFLSTYLNSMTYFDKPVILEETWFQLHPHLQNNAEQVMYLDMRTYLHDDVLCKVDRASMAVGLETRAPFLDYNLVDFAWSIPLVRKFRGRVKKYLLKRVLERYVPRTLWDRPKMGFGMPLAQAFRTSLQSTWEQYLETHTLLWNHIDRTKAKQLWQEHLSGKYNHEIQLWNLFVAQQWLIQRG
ncbi:MAG: asparagine synthase (glutamine-hydrolyzing) [Puniceicoccales bacterium]|jgi:asparagine synthase (glutamine-hydrolysing)|nr:asparagine synthase (glutamine-hydrolyzing) [Puniceicoccales bacterium]